MSKKEIVVEQEIQDEELKEEPKQILDVKEDKKEKGSSKLLLTLLIIFIVIFITLIGIICYGFKTGKINFESKKETKENVDIKHTEVVTVKSDGV